MGTGLAPLFVWAAMRGKNRWKGFTRPTLVAAVLSNLPGVTFWITFAAAFRLLSIEGLTQPAGLVVVLIWIFFVAVKLRHGRQSQYTEPGTSA